MKFTSNFLDILKHFKNINQNIYFREGNIQTSAIISSRDELLFFVRANTDVQIETPFAIGNLGKLITTLEMFNNPDITVEKDTLLIEEEGKTVNYKLSNPDCINYHKNPDKVQSFTGGIDTSLTKDNINDILCMSKLFMAKHVTFFGRNGQFSVNIWNADNSSSDIGSIIIGTTDENFESTISSDNFKISPENYKLTIFRKPLIHLNNATYEYFIPIEANYSKLQG